MLRGDLKRRLGRFWLSYRSPRSTCSLPVKKHFATLHNHFLKHHLTRPPPPRAQTAIDGDRSWLTKEELAKFNEATPLLKDLLAKGHKPVIHNTDKLQKDDASTCGRWAMARVINSEMPMEAFVEEMKSGPGTPDQNVTAYTYNIIHK